MYCSNCGRENKGSPDYCTGCGAGFGQNPAMEENYAGFPKRFAAAIIDYVIITVINSLLAGILLSINEAEAVALILDFGGLVVGCLYYAFMESSSSRATLGKRALGIIVTDMKGNKISFGRAMLRFIAKIPSALILFIGFFMIPFTKKKQGLHDMLAETLVLQKN